MRVHRLLDIQSPAPRIGVCLAHEDLSEATFDLLKRLRPGFLRVDFNPVGKDPNAPVRTACHMASVLDARLILSINVSPDITPARDATETPEITQAFCDAVKSAVHEAQTHPVIWEIVGGGDPDTSVRTFREVATTIRCAAPHACIVGPGEVGHGDPVRRLIPHGFAAFADGLSIRPLRKDPPETLPAELNTLQAAQTTADELPILLSAVGYPGADEATNAAYLERTLILASCNPAVRAVLWSEWRGKSPAALVTPDGRTTPLFDRLKTLLDRLRNYHEAQDGRRITHREGWTEYVYRFRADSVTTQSPRQFFMEWAVPAKGKRLPEGSPFPAVPVPRD